MKYRSLVAALGAAMLLNSGCGRREAGPAGAAGPSDAVAAWNARVQAARQHFPTQPIAPCAEPVRGVLLLRGGATPLAFCPSFGDVELFGDYLRIAAREPASWQARRVGALSSVAMFEPTEQRAPVATGAGAGLGTITPGLLAGRVVVFDPAGAPRCQVDVRATGPDSASETAAMSLQHAAEQGLCRNVQAAIGRALAHTPGT